MNHENNDLHRASLPHPDLTPGAFTADPPELVLSPGYALTFRRLGNQLRRQVFDRYRIPWSDRMRYDVDHLVAVSLGGTSDLENLWPHPWHAPFNPRHKQSLEQRLRALVINGLMALKEAQRLLCANWVAAYLSLFGPDSRPAIVRPSGQALIAPIMEVMKGRRMTTDEVADALEMDAGRVRRVMYALLRSRQIVKVGKQPRGRLHAS